MISDSYRNSHPFSLTVVIATLGGDCLEETIRNLNSGSIVPSEVLICIPASEAHKVSDRSFPNSKVIATACKGQVAQRAIGFTNASCKYVMQLDDDVLVEKRCVEHLLRTLDANGPRVAVAPSLYCISTRESFYKTPSNKLLLKFYYWLLNGSFGYQPGKITSAGTNVGIDPSNSNQETFDVDWLPGGCVIHRKENLVSENFYPFAGKAYCEDIIHSHHLKTRGIKLVVSSKAICWVECAPVSSHSWRGFIKNLVFDFKARRFFVRVTSRSFWRMALYYVVSVLRYGYIRLFERVP